MSDVRSGFAQEMERRAKARAREDARLARAAERSKTYAGDDLKPFYEMDPATGCWMWAGECRTYGSGDREIPITRARGRHAMCGIAHNAMSRVFYEEQLGRR